MSEEDNELCIFRHLGEALRFEQEPLKNKAAIYTGPDVKLLQAQLHEPINELKAEMEPSSSKHETRKQDRPTIPIDNSTVDESSPGESGGASNPGVASNASWGKIRIDNRELKVKFSSVGSTEFKELDGWFRLEPVTNSVKASQDYGIDLSEHEYAVRLVPVSSQDDFEMVMTRKKRPESDLPRSGLMHVKYPFVTAGVSGVSDLHEVRRKSTPAAKPKRSSSVRKSGKIQLENEDPSEFDDKHTGKLPGEVQVPGRLRADGYSKLDRMSMSRPKSRKTVSKFSLVKYDNLQYNMLSRDRNLKRKPKEKYSHCKRLMYDFELTGKEICDNAMKITGVIDSAKTNKISIPYVAMNVGYVLDEGVNNNSRYNIQNTPNYNYSSNYNENVIKKRSRYTNLEIGKVCDAEKTLSEPLVIPSGDGSDKMKTNINKYKYNKPIYNSVDLFVKDEKELYLKKNKIPPMGRAKLDNKSHDGKEFCKSIEELTHAVCDATFSAPSIGEDDKKNFQAQSLLSIEFDNLQNKSILTPNLKQTFDKESIIKKLYEPRCSSTINDYRYLLNCTENKLIQRLNKSISRYKSKKYKAFTGNRKLKKYESYKCLSMEYLYRRKEHHLSKSNCIYYDELNFKKQSNSEIRIIKSEPNIQQLINPPAITKQLTSEASFKVRRVPSGSSSRCSKKCQDNPCSSRGTKRSSLKKCSDDSCSRNSDCDSSDSIRKKVTSSSSRCLKKNIALRPKCKPKKPCPKKTKCVEPKTSSDSCRSSDSTKKQKDKNPCKKKPAKLKCAKEKPSCEKVCKKSSKCSTSSHDSCSSLKSNSKCQCDDPKCENKSKDCGDKVRGLICPKKYEVVKCEPEKKVCKSQSKILSKFKGLGKSGSSGKVRTGITGRFRVTADYNTGRLDIDVDKKSRKELICILNKFADEYDKKCKAQC